MPNTLLVTTDFSAKSKGAIRFAIQLSQQTKQSLVFFHCAPYLRPSRWTDAQYNTYAKAEAAKITRALERLVLDIFRKSGVKKPKFECVVRQSPDVRKAIVRQARQSGADAICISTRGAGKLKKWLGTHTSAIINASPVPVFVIPANYRRNPIKHIVYASDLNHIGAELKVVRKIARPLKAKITVLHYDYLADVGDVRKKLDKVAKKHKSANVKFRFRKQNIDKSLAHHLVRDIKSSKTSLAVLFTNQKRGWFDKMFLSSRSVDVAHHAKVPLLILAKD